MEERRRKHSVALDALEVVAKSVAVLKRAPLAEGAELLTVARDAWELLNERRLPREVGSAVVSVIGDFLACFIEARTTIKERLDDENAREKETVRNVVGKLAISILCVALSVVLAVKDASGWACAPVLIILYVWGDKAPLRWTLKAARLNRRR